MRVAILAVWAVLVGSIIAEELLVTPEYTDYLKKHVSWEVADYDENIFKGWTVDEFRHILNGSSHDSSIPTSDLSTPTPRAHLPTVISWKGAQCVHEPHDQGRCSSCWAFTTASVVADKCCLGKTDFGWLSPQELVSCDNKKNSGCTLGTVEAAMQYVKTHGLVKEQCYPYKAQEENCPTACKDGSDWKSAHVCKPSKIVDCGTLPNMKTCLQTGPIAAYMVVYRDFLSYKGGVYCWDHKGSQLGGQNIRCLGYDEKPIPNFQCANSWGVSWGEQGFFRISLVDSCGLAPLHAWTAEGF
jgi:C1A family cysteine protease